MTTPSSRFKSEFLRQIPRLRGFALSLTRDRNAAEDLMQDTALRAWANADRFSVDANIHAEMRSWLCRILYNRWIDTRRAAKGTVSLEEIDLDGGDAAERLDSKNPLPAAFIVNASQDIRVEAIETGIAFGRLVPIHRQAILRQAIDEEPLATLAAAHGCAIGTLKSRLSRARNELTRLMV